MVQTRMLFAALSYDATQLLMKAIETAGSTDPQAIHKSFSSNKDFDGVIWYILNGSWPHTSEISSSHRVQNGQEVSAQGELSWLIKF